MIYQTPFDQQEMPASMIEQLACIPCNDNESIGSLAGSENDSEIDVSFSSRGTAFSYLSAGTSPMARALERVGNEVTVEVPRQRSRKQRKQNKKSRGKQARQAQPQLAPSMQHCRFFRSKKGCSRPDCPYVHC